MLATLNMVQDGLLFDLLREFGVFFDVFDDEGTWLSCIIDVKDEFRWCEQLEDLGKLQPHWTIANLVFFSRHLSMIRSESIIGVQIRTAPCTWPRFFHFLFTFDVHALT